MLLKTNGYAGTLFGTNQGGSPRFQFVNSIFSDLAHSFYVEAAGLWSRNCLFYDMPGQLFSGFADIPTVSDLNGLPNCAGNLSALPALLNPAQADFSPSYGSPCIDAGAVAGVRLPAFDFFGRPRTNGLMPDIGPVEYDPAFVDSDGDGLTDAQETTAGTNPADSHDCFHIDIRPAGPGGQRHAVSWQGLANRRYDLLTSTNPLSGWTAVPGGTNLPGAGATLTFTNFSDGLAHFYRAKVWRQ
jgi:hypothetical protein